MLERVGIGIVTRNRLNFINSLINSLTSCNYISDLVVINDSETDLHITGVHVINNGKNIGVGKSKNKAMQYLLEGKSDYIFILEDDLQIIDTDIFHRYIEASKVTGIQHFNYGPGTPFNRKQNTHFDLYNRNELDTFSQPAPKITVEYNDSVSIDLYEHCAGVLSFFTSTILNEVGLHDEAFYNAWEHVDHTLRIINHRAHPPFWWFADITDSYKFLTVQEDSINKSVTAENKEEWFANIHRGRETYKTKHGFYPNMCPLSTKVEVIEALKYIKSKWTI
jgi:glycosyltransferase involved in cell wall biosynthesis